MIIKLFIQVLVIEEVPVTRSPEKCVTDTPSSNLFVVGVPGGRKKKITVKF